MIKYDDVEKTLIKKRPIGRPPKPKAEPMEAGQSDDDAVCQALIEAAAHLIADKGIAATTIREIGEAASVNPAMIHYYFKNKDGLHQAVFKYVAETMLAKVAESLTDDEGDVTTTLIGALSDTARKEPWIIRVLQREVFLEDGEARRAFADKYASKALPMIIAHIEAGQAEGIYRSDFDARLAVMSLIGMTAFPFIARPIIEPLLGLNYDDEFQAKFVEHTARFFLEGAGPKPEHAS